MLSGALAAIAVAWQSSLRPTPYLCAFFPLGGPAPEASLQPGALAEATAGRVELWRLPEATCTGLFAPPSLSAPRGLDRHSHLEAAPALIVDYSDTLILVFESGLILAPLCGGRGWCN